MQENIVQEEALREPSGQHITARRKGRAIKEIVAAIESDPPAEDAPPVAAEQLAAHDLPYHRTVAADYTAATERLRNATADLAAAEGALRSWMRHVSQTYGLTEAETVDENGVITRRAAPHEG